jgi:drug/metabolite transporter (DMT)-like permease
VLGISFSAVFVRLAGVSPVTAVFYRALYALPFLTIIWLALGRGYSRPRRARLLAVGSGLLLAVDLALWHQSIALIGVGLATVVANVQVIFVAAAAWLLYGEHPSKRMLFLIGLALIGVALTSGLARADAYGPAPVQGAMFGVLAGACYAGFLLVFRSANRSLTPTSGPLLESTLGTAAGALLVAPLDPRFSLAVPWPGHLWLLLLGLVSQVAGWLLIANALPRLPPLETSALLLAQPVFAIIWGVVIFSERLSPLQWLGSVVVLAGVAAISAGRHQVVSR